MPAQRTGWTHGGVQPGTGFGVIGCTPDGVVMSRHSPGVCKPGLWNVALAVAPEVARLLGMRWHSTAAVVDEFGNLVGVPA